MLKNNEEKNHDPTNIKYKSVEDLVLTHSLRVSARRKKVVQKRIRKKRKRKQRRIKTKTKTKTTNQQIYKGRQERRHEFADRGKNGLRRQKSIASLWIRVICITIGFVKGKAQIQRIR